MNRNDTKKDLSALSALVGLNVYVLDKNTIFFREDNVTSSGYQILKRSEIAVVDHINVTLSAEYEIVENLYRERYMVFVLPDFTWLVMGPFLLRPSDGGELRGLLRTMQISLADSNRFLRHHQILPVHSRRFCQSLLALLEQMFPAQRGLPYASDGSFSQSNSRITKGNSQRDIINQQYQGTIVENRMDYRVRSPIALENKLLLYIEQGNWPKAEETLEDINSLDSAVFAADPVQSKKYSLVAGCTLYTRGVIRGGIDYMTAFSLSDAMIRTAHRLETLDELNAFEYEMVEMFCKTIEEQSKGKYSLPIRRIMEYISVNLTAVIDLPAIAKHVYMHPNYVSNLFAKEVGLPISKYIQKMRIEESKLLLIGTSETMAAISNYYQFCNEAYYIRVFREHEGTTPSQFRLSHAGMASRV